MNLALSVVFCRSPSLCSSDGATHCTEWPNRCSSRKHCISKPTSGSITMRSPSKTPVRGGSRSRYSMAKPYLTMPDETLIQRSTRSSPGIWPTSRVPTISWPARSVPMLDLSSLRGCRDQLTRSERQRGNRRCGLAPRRRDEAAAVADEQVLHVVRAVVFVDDRRLRVVAHAARAEQVDGLCLRQDFLRP